MTVCILKHGPIRFRHEGLWKTCVVEPERRMWLSRLLGSMPEQKGLFFSVGCVSNAVGRPCASGQQAPCCEQANSVDLNTNLATKSISISWRPLERWGAYAVSGMGCSQKF